MPFRLVSFLFLFIVLLCPKEFALLVSAQNDNRVTAACPPPTTSNQVCGNVTVTITNNDLYNMPSIQFLHSNNDGEMVVVAEYIKSRSIRRTYDDKSVQVIWEGFIVEPKDRVGSATFVQMSNALGGTFTTEEYGYTVLPLPNGTYTLRNLAWSDVQENDADIPKGYDKDGSSTKPIDDTITIEKTQPFQKTKNEEISPGPAFGTIQGGGRRLQQQQQQHRNLQSFVTVDVLLLVSNRAMCSAAGLAFGCSLTDFNRIPISIMIATAQSSAAATMRDGIIPVSFRFVSTQYLAASDGDKHTIQSTIDWISSSKSVQDLRKKNGADLVVVIGTPDNVGGVCGIGQINGHASAVSYSCLSAYTLTHEMGHAFGCNHNIEDVPESQKAAAKGYGFGFRLPGVHRTVMSYECPSISCPRIPLFSSATGTYNSYPIGSASENNRRMLIENSGSVASWQSCKIDCNSGGGACFSGFNTIDVRGKGTITMDLLQIGDYVLVGRNKYSQVYSFSHIDRNQEAEFLQMHIEGMDATSPLELSPDHMVFVKDVPVRASDVKVGDMLGDHRVSRIEVIYRRGVYAPVTVSGDLLVSGVLASSYVATLDRWPTRVLQTGSHTLAGFHRLVCSMNFNICLQESYVDGISNYIFRVVELIRTINTWNIVIQMAVAILTFPFILLAFILQQPYMPSLFIVLTFLLYKNHRRLTCLQNL